MNKRKFSLRRLFSNTKFLIIFSIFVAFIFWIVVALEYAPIVENTVEDVPVVIDMENSVPDKFGLKIFGQSDFKVNITVRGSRYIVGGELLDADDFEVEAQTAYVNSAGSHTLQLKVTAKDPESDFEILGLSTDYIEVYFDKEAEKEISLEARVVTKLSKLTDGDYLFDENDLIVPEKTVKIVGAQTEVEKIEKAYANIEIDKKLTESSTVDAVVTLDNGTEEAARYVTINGEESYSVPVTIPVYRSMTVTPTVAFQSIPSGYIDNPISYTCNPSSVKVAILQSGDESSDVFTVGTIDFSEISPDNCTFKFDADSIKNIKFLDDTKSVTVTLDASGLSSKEFTVDDTAVKFKNNDEDSFDFDATSLEKITVVGSAEALAKLKASDITVTVDSGKLDENESGKVTVDVTLSDKSDCWIFGTYELEITRK